MSEKIPRPAKSLCIFIAFRNIFLANFNKLGGCSGYMSPEYAFYGQFSVKSDVFSFGVLIIEIVAGKKSTRFLDSEKPTEDLLSFVSRHY